MIDGFKKFISRGNMIDMAVGVVMGGAVTAVVNAIVNHLINPLIAMIFGKPNMDGLLAFTFNGATVSVGAILGALLNFLIIAVAVYFFILVPINKFRDSPMRCWRRRSSRKVRPRTPTKSRNPSPPPSSRQSRCSPKSATNWPKPNQNSHHRWRGYRRADWAPAIACS